MPPSSSIVKASALGGEIPADITRLVRRVCLLREQGKADEAERVRAVELAEALRAFNSVAGDDALSESAVASLFAREENRVAEATALAELLIPQLLAHLTPAAPSSPASVAMFAKRAEPACAEARPLPTGASPAIPDLLDAMLAAERSTRRALTPHSARA